MTDLGYLLGFFASLSSGSAFWIIFVLVFFALVPWIIVCLFFRKLNSIDNHLSDLCKMQYDFNKKFISKDSTSNSNENRE